MSAVYNGKLERLGGSWAGCDRYHPGGGAVNDLAWLNDYALARTICELPVPVLTGIGHERDSTIIDEVANMKFDTPSKVAAGIEHANDQKACPGSQGELRIADVSRSLCAQQGPWPC